MVGLEREIPARLLVPMCPGCGETRVVHADGDPRLRCPRCRLDLYTHRPRSYAEMEGLVDAEAVDVPMHPGSAGMLRRARTWFGLLRVKLGIR